MRTEIVPTITNNGVVRKNLFNKNLQRKITKPNKVALRYRAITNGSAPVKSFSIAKTARNNGGSAMISDPTFPLYLTRLAILLATEKYWVVSGKTPIPWLIVAHNNKQAPKNPVKAS
jgi:hypothetical protein